MIAVTQENRCGNQQATSAGEILDLQHLLQENRALRCDRNFYKSLLERATAREALLKQEIQQLNARIRYLEKRLYGRKSEKKTAKSKSNSSTARVIYPYSLQKHDVTMAKKRQQWIRDKQIFTFLIP